MDRVGFNIASKSICWHRSQSIEVFGAAVPLLCLSFDVEIWDVVALSILDFRIEDGLRADAELLNLRLEVRSIILWQKRVI